MTQEPPYIPIDCAFHDRLEAQAVLGRRSRLRFDRGDGTVVEEEGWIVHITAKGSAEYLRLDSGTEVRLDRVLALEDAGVGPPAGAPGDPDCPLCGAAGYPRAAERDGRRYLECPRCRLVFLDPAQWLGREEERARYEAHDNRPDDPGYRAFLGRLADPLVARLRPGAEGLDFGSGPGPTLSALLEERGFPMAIYDPFFAPDPEALERSYDFITCTETIEHFFHPREEISRLSSLLRPGGLLAIMTEVLRDETDFSEWWYRRDPTHVAFYREETFAWIGRTFGWSLEQPHRNVVIFGRGGRREPPEPEIFGTEIESPVGTEKVSGDRMADQTEGRMIEIDPQWLGEVDLVEGTTTQATPGRVSKGWLRAASWIAAYAAAVLAPLVFLLVFPAPAGGGFWWNFAIGLGFAGLVMMGVQFLLTARFKRATAPFGIDVIYYFHRYLAYVLLTALVAHPLILLIANPALVHYLNPLRAPWEITAGTASLVLLLALVGSSAWRKQLRFHYDEWRIAHLVLAVGAVALAFAHMGAIGFYSGVTPVRMLWIVIGLSLLAIVARVRLVRPWGLRAKPFRVVSVERDLGDTWLLTVEPEGHEGFRFEPGQFAWVTIRRSPFAMKEHPFSIASTPSSDGRLEFAIKELGDFTRTVGEIPPGERAFVDGPYGAFSIDRVPDAPGYGFLAGGIGVAPVVAMLRALADRGDTRRHIVITAHSAWDRIPLRDAVRQLQGKLRLKVVHVLESPPEGWSEEEGWITREVLDRHLPEDRRDLEYFVCGPVPMIGAVTDLLHEMGVPDNQVHTELFNLV